MKKGNAPSVHVVRQKVVPVTRIGAQIVVQNGSLLIRSEQVGNIYDKECNTHLS